MILALPRSGLGGDLGYRISSEGRSLRRSLSREAGVASTANLCDDEVGVPEVVELCTYANEGDAYMAHSGSR